MDRKGIIGVVFGVMVAIGVVLWMARDADHDDEPGESPTAAQTANPESSPAMTEEEDVSAETSEDPGYVTRLPNYELASPHPGSWRDALPRIAFTPEMILDYSDEMMQDALGGDLDAAFA
ncbi:MAG: hypothetical protein R3233_03165, partial [Xanthomonadales bacterium]|nr:hypothetical protein [Xanthomonadales bacterium]